MPIKPSDVNIFFTFNSKIIKLEEKIDKIIKNAFTSGKQKNEVSIDLSLISEWADLVEATKEPLVLNDRLARDYRKAGWKVFYNVNNLYILPPKENIY